MKENQKCSFEGRRHAELIEGTPHDFGSHNFSDYNLDKKKFKPKKMIRCPECGRRLQARTVFTTEGDFMIFTIPPHKKKGWWKKKPV